MRAIGELYKYLFFKLYSWNIEAFGKRELPTLNALLHLSLLMYINLMTTLLVVEMLVGITLINFEEVSVTVLVILSLSVLAINYFGLVYNSRLQGIIDLYANESDEKKKSGNITLGWYIGLTILTLLIVLVFKSAR